MVQVAMICICLTGESFAQSVMCPFLYYLVRDFHVGPDKWIGYYAGLLWTGFWAANLATTLFWGYLSDKYGRKVILLFGLIMTSISTLFLGLSSCYHDAMLAMVIQGACTGLVPVSKCAIGEMANRQQRFYDMEVSKEQQLQEQRRLEQQQNQGSSNQLYSEDNIDEKTEIDAKESDWTTCHDNIINRKTVPSTREDFSAKGYSALVIALALGAALGPLVGGSLTKKHIPGFESYPYFAPCLVATLVGVFLAGIVALILNETHPKWVRLAEQEQPLKNNTMHHAKSGASTATSNRGGKAPRPLAESIEVHEAIDAYETQDHSYSDSPYDAGLDRGAETRGTGSRVKCIRPVTALSVSPIRISTLSPATELYLILTIYTLLVLISILGSEFVMLYTQSPILRGGLGFSANVLGKVLTIRGILKLLFTLFGYPAMVDRLGLQKCLKLGIFVIGTVSVFGLGMFAPWNIQNSIDKQLRAEHGTSIRGDVNIESIGVGVVLICLSIISIGDALGYISVLVLFGRAADRLKGTKRSLGINVPGSLDPTDAGAAQGGSGVLWSLAQVSANVMRLAGPVVAGLLWSLAEKAKENQSSVKYPAIIGHLDMHPLPTSSLPVGEEKVIIPTVWTAVGSIVKGTTSVFFLVGAICIVNSLACHYWTIHSSSATTTVHQKPLEIASTA
ncbi:hypothetical protein BGX27_008943 [Mortierella sp. AM989]|nr:hypothetical protein BGX27_008943 [Mortierella sp. AM989]